MRRRGCANRDLWGEDAIEAGVGGSGPDIAKGGGPTPLKKKWRELPQGGPALLGKNGESCRRTAYPLGFGKKWRELPQEP